MRLPLPRPEDLEPAPFEFGVSRVRRTHLRAHAEADSGVSVPATSLALQRKLHESGSRFASLNALVRFRHCNFWPQTVRSWTSRIDANGGMPSATKKVR